MPDPIYDDFDSILDDDAYEDDTDLDTEDQDDLENDDAQDQDDDDDVEDQDNEADSDDEDDDETDDEDEDSDDEDEDSDEKPEEKKPEEKKPEEKKPEEKKPEEKKPEEEKSEEPKTWKVKVDGNEREVDEAELVRGYATAQAATERFQEAKQLHQEASTFFRSFLSSPGDALASQIQKRNPNATPLQVREAVCNIFLEWMSPDLEESMIEDPAEKKLFRQRREINEEQKRLDARKNAEAAEQQKAADAEFIRDLTTEYDSQIKAAGLPTEGEAGDAIWNSVMSILGDAEKAGTKRVELLNLVKTAVKQVAEAREAQAKALIPTLKPEELKALFPDAAEALKKERIEQVQAKRSQKKAGAAKKARKRKRNRKPRYVTPEEVFD